LQEYPHHLIAIGDRARLEDFLTQWPTFDELFDDEYSYRLLVFWREVRMAAATSKRLIQGQGVLHWSGTVTVANGIARFPAA